MPSPRTKRGLAAEIGRRLKQLREAYNYSQDDAARHLGVTLVAYRDMEGGRKLPPPEVQARAVALYFNGKTWWKAPTLALDDVKRADGWHRVAGHISPATYEKLRGFCRDTGYSREAVVAVALSRLLDTGAATITTIKEAIRAVEEARLVELLLREPKLQVLLDCDMELARHLGLRVKPEPVEGEKGLRPVPEDRLSNAVERKVELAPWVRRLEKV